MPYMHPLIVDNMPPCHLYLLVVKLVPNNVILSLLLLSIRNTYGDEYGIP